jgi:sugar lactone lactonase YvrE
VSAPAGDGAEPRCIWDGAAILGEGPLWIAEENALYFLDVKAPAIHRLDAATGNVRSWPWTEQIGSLAPRAGGGFVAGMKSGFAFVEPARGEIERIANPEEALPGNRFNDGKVDAAGRFWAGTMDDGEHEPTGALYRLDADRSWRRMDSGYAITNGPAFNRAGTILYHTDTLKRAIYAFDFAPDGSITNRREFILIPEDQGHPDGMTTDAEDHLWVAHYGGWRLTRFTPGGEVDRVIRLPVAQVTSCAFGGKHFDRLYITTASKQLDDGALRLQPLAGGLFVVEPGVTGLPPNRFAG